MSCLLKSGRVLHVRARYLDRVDVAGGVTSFLPLPKKKKKEEEEEEEEDVIQADTNPPCHDEMFLMRCVFSRIDEHACRWTGCPE